MKKSIIFIINGGPCVIQQQMSFKKKCLKKTSAHRDGLGEETQVKNSRTLIFNQSQSMVNPHCLSCIPTKLRWGA